jgi:hypothetical protein
VALVDVEMRESILANRRVNRGIAAAAKEHGL